jgi:hypothetical protein
MKIITPGVFLLAALLTTACTETDDIATEGDDPRADEPQPTDTAECCAPDSPHGDDLIFDSFDAGRRARERFDWLRHAR